VILPSQNWNKEIITRVPDNALVKDLGIDRGRFMGKDRDHLEATTTEETTGYRRTDHRDAFRRTVDSDTKRRMAFEGFPGSRTDEIRRSNGANR